MEILVDTSVWIDFFSGTDSPEALQLAEFLEAERFLCVCDVVVTEFLQDFRKDRDFENAREKLGLFPVFSLASPDGYVRAAELYRTCRKNGITPRGTVDCLIAQTAIDHGLVLLHKEADFERMASVSELRTVRAST